MQSAGSGPGEAGLHIAIIMDGNGRWANRRGLPRVAGHRAGAKAVRRTVEAARELNIDTLTLFAFSSDNWQRPHHEVGLLMRLFRDYLEGETQRMLKNGIRLNVIGRRDRLPLPVRDAIERAEAATAHCHDMSLRVAVDYSARDAILKAAQIQAGQELTRDQFARLIGQALNDCQPARDVDLLIRTSGEQRLSDFLLWECAYAELYFVDRFWPEFDKSALEEAIQQFRSRQRRFGKVPAPLAV